MALDVKSTVKISSIFMAFLENMNFILSQLVSKKYWHGIYSFIFIFNVLGVSCGLLQTWTPYSPSTNKEINFWWLGHQSMLFFLFIYWLKKWQEDTYVFLQYLCKNINLWIHNQFQIWLVLYQITKDFIYFCFHNYWVKEFCNSSILQFKIIFE